MILNSAYNRCAEGDCPYQNPNALPTDPRIDRIINKHLRNLGKRLKDRKARRRIPGAAVMVRRGSVPVHVNCYGFANLETGEKITPYTLFDLGSLSKQFTAIAALNLIIAGQFKTKSKLSEFLDYFPRYADEVTVEELIHHTSALPDYFKIYGANKRVNEDWYEVAMRRPSHWYPQMAKRSKLPITNNKVVKWIASQKLLAEEPNSEFEYSNSGYVVLAAVVESAAEARLAEYLKKSIFDPLEMNSTYVFDDSTAFARDAPEILNHATCYNRVPNRAFVPIGYTPMNFVYGDGNIHSNILDLATWDWRLHRLDYAAYKNETQEEAAQQIREMLWKPIRIKNHKRVKYGAGWHLLRSKYKRTFKRNGNTFTRKYESHGEFHRGEWLGWRSYIARAARWEVPKRDQKTWDSLGIVVLSNNYRFEVETMVQKISQLFWGKEHNIMNRFDLE